VLALWRVRYGVRWTGLVVLGALWLPSTVAWGQGPPDAIARILARAEAAAERGQDRRAWTLFNVARRRAEADDPRPAIAEAEALPEEAAEPTDAWRSRAAEARDAHDELAAEAPEHPQAARAARLRAWAAALAGEHAEAIERASAAAGLQDRESAALLRRLATLAVLRQDLPSARRALIGAHRAMPQESATLSDLGAVELALGRPGAAVERFARVLGRRPDDLLARRDLAGAMVAAGRAEAAVEILTQAAAAHPGDIDLRLELAHAALEAGDHAMAERAARAAIERSANDDGRGHTVLGAALTAQGRREDARAAFEEALRRDPGDVRARQGLESASGEPPGRSGRGASVARGLAAP